MTQIVDPSTYIENGSALNYNFEKMNFISTAFISNATGAIIFISY